VLKLKMRFSTIAILLGDISVAQAVDIEKRQSCPKVYTFGARETTVSAGYGTAGGLVNQIKSAFPGSGSEAIVYPACGGQGSCGGVSYDRSQSQGTAAVVKAVTAYVKKCPKTQIILVGYSQVSKRSRYRGLTFPRVGKSWIMLSPEAPVRLLPVTP
jgi:acetylxylan esterase